MHCASPPSTLDNSVTCCSAVILTTLLTIFFLSYPSDVQGLLLALHLSLTTGSAQGPYVVSMINSWFAARKVSVQPAALLYYCTLTLLSKFSADICVTPFDPAQCMLEIIHKGHQ